MKPKMVDYAGDEDFSANFKRRGQECGVSKYQVWQIYAGKHWDAISSFVKNGQTESEDIRDRLADVINYLLILSGMIEDDNVELIVKPDADAAPTLHIDPALCPLEGADG